MHQLLHRICDAGHRDWQQEHVICGPNHGGQDELLLRARNFLPRSYRCHYTVLCACRDVTPLNRKDDILCRFLAASTMNLVSPRSLSFLSFAFLSPVSYLFTLESVVTTCIYLILKNRNVSARKGDITICRPTENIFHTKKGVNSRVSRKMLYCF